MSDQKRFYLSDCVEAYLPLDDQLKTEFDAMLAREQTGVPAMNLTTYDRGIIKGRQEGRQEGLENGQRGMLRILMEERFGPLPTPVVDRLQSMSMDELIQLGKAAVMVNSIEELRL